MRLRSINFLTLVGFLSLLLCWLSALGSSNYDLSAEGLNSFAFIRLSQGKLFASRSDSVPLLLCNYSPYFFEIFKKPLLLLGDHFLWSELLTLGRAALFLFFVGSAGTVFLLAKKIQIPNVFLALVWASAILGILPVTLKPDFPSFFFELAGFAVFYEFYLGRSQPPIKTLLLSSFLFAVGTVFKLNTVGFVGAAALVLLVGKRFWHFSVFTGLFLGVMAGAYALARHSWGEVFSANVLPCMLGRLRHLDASFFPVLKGLLIDLLFWNSAFFLLGWMGLKKIWLSSRDRQKTLFLALAIGLSFFWAFVGQFREGAAFNYFAGCFLLLAIPVAVALTEILQQRGFGGKKLLVIFFFFVTAFSAARLGLQNLFGRHARAPFYEVAHYVSENFPRMAVYTNTGNLAVFLHDQVLLGPSAESNLDLCRGLDKFIPQLKETIHTQPFRAAVIYGDDCKAWHPSGIFREELEPLTSLRKNFGRICVFEERKL